MEKRTHGKAPSMSSGVLSPSGHPPWVQTLPQPLTDTVMRQDNLREPQFLLLYMLAVGGRVPNVGPGPWQVEEVRETEPGGHMCGETERRGVP